MSEIPPPPIGDNWHGWGERIQAYLARVRDKLSFKDADSRANIDGVLLWDRETEQVVVSHDGEWVGLGHNDYGSFYTTTTFTAAAANTAYPITWSDVVAEAHITRDDALPIFLGNSCAAAGGLRKLWNIPTALTLLQTSSEAC
jgi:hypothetical protein